MANHTIDDVVSKVEQAVTGAVSGTIRRHFHGLFSDYTTYKQTHDAILSLPAVKNAILSGGVGVDCRVSVGDTKEHQSQDLIQCLETIEELQQELRTIKLENAALRLQLETKTYVPKTSNESESENITLVIEEKENKCNETLGSSEVHTVRIKTEPIYDEDQSENYMDTRHVEEHECNENALSDTDDVEDEEDVNEDDGEEEEEAAEDDRDEEEETDEEVVEKGKNDEDENEENDLDHDNQSENQELAVQTETGREEKVVSSCGQNEDVGSNSGSETVDSQDSDSEEVEVFEIEIKGKTYFTTDEKSGIIYACLPDGDIGHEIGMFVNSKPNFHSKQKK